MSEAGYSGGCQCGAVRFHAGKLGRPSICHCRMCQKHFGNFFGALVTADQAHLTWTRGQPSLFRSSTKIHRGFCNKCGTPLTYHYPGGVEIAIGAFDHPDQIEPQVQVNAHMQMPWIKALFDKPEIKQSVDESTIISYQHPDHDSVVWPPEDEANKA
ncbi:GFA family protein [Agrobacterium tumefaciens]|nr:GFA family protein [Agrobacterium tumefaciens]